jgi:catechol 2,3-dioxygenase-like lactoylglutathione lyase family enzyme
MSDAPSLSGVLETALYVGDVDRAAEFYHRVFGFELLFKSERGAGLSVVGRQVLLLFRKGGTTEAIVTERGEIPPHDGDGNLHVAFAIPADSLEAWEKRLTAEGVEVEARYNWERGGRSLYFRDLDAHVIELVTPGCWAIY